MSEVETRYILTDDEGEKYNITLTHRYCGCQSLGCVDDELSIDVDQDGGMYRVQIPRDMTMFIEGLITGDCKAVKVEL